MNRFARALTVIAFLGLTLSAIAPALAQDDAARAQPPIDTLTAERAAAELPQAGPRKPRTRDLVIFWSFGALVIIGAIAVITRTNPVVAVMCLVGTFIAIAAIYVMLLAHFLAIIQVLVYAGAIMVLFVFVVMILNRDEEGAWRLEGWVGKGLGVLAAIYLCVKFILVLGRSTDALNLQDTWTAAEAAQFGTTRAIGQVLFTEYLFPFEAVSLLLLIAVVGALVLSRGREVPKGVEHAADGTTHGSGAELREIQGRPPLPGDTVGGPQ